MHGKDAGLIHWLDTARLGLFDCQGPRAQIREAAGRYKGSPQACDFGRNLTHAPAHGMVRLQTPACLCLEDGRKAKDAIPGNGGRSDGQAARHGAMDP